MIELTDAKMVNELSRIFNFQPERIIWGQLFTAKKYWVQFQSDQPGIAELPYMAFYRIPRFHDTFKKSELVQVIDYDDVSREMRSLPVMLNYTVEIMTKTVREQNELFKSFMFWVTSESKITFTDDTGVEWSFRIIAEDPEDNSDLEAEEDIGRIIRSTFNIQVESIMLDKSDIAGPILDILARIHGYYDSISESFSLGEIHIQE